MPQKIATPRPLQAIKSLLDGVLEVISTAGSYVILAIANVVMRIVDFMLELTKRFNSRFVRFSKGSQSRLGSYFSKNSKSRVGMMVVYAGLSRNPEDMLGIVLMYSIMLSAATTFLAVATGPEPYFGLPPRLIILMAMVGPFAVTWTLFYVVFMVLIDRRTSSVEKVLPDILTMISQNMIAGMTVYNSLWIAARPEFGPLAMEIQTVARETLGGESFEKSLMNMSERIKSYKLSRSVKLMIQGMRSGGELPTVLQEIANDIRAEQNLFKRMSAQTTSQAMFILFALLIGAPLLFSSSLQFVTIFNRIYEKVGFNDETSALPQQTGMISLQKLPISSTFFFQYAVITLFVLGIFGALLIGLIKNGKLSSGVPLVPVIALLSVLIFWLMTIALGSFFKGMMTM
ncbi:MAG: type II secretion system F family protein [Candidatus Altiarchaeia archaeon]